MKRYLTILLTVVLLILALSTQVFAAEASGICGDNLTWTLDADNTLTISGKGPMEDYPSLSDMPWFRYRNTIQKIVIQSGVTTIGNYSFSNLKNVTVVTIPDSVTGIGRSAFSNCSSLAAVVIPDSVIMIGNDAFRNCTALYSVTISDNVTGFGTSLFVGSNVKKLIIAEGSEKVTSDMVMCESTLEEIVLPNTVTEIGEEAFSYCTAFVSFTIPDSVTTIGDYAFRGCSNLTDITIPSSVTTIGKYAFRGCALNSFVLPNTVTELGDGVFADSALVDITIADGITAIPFETFAFCRKLERITIPDSVTNIGRYAFYDCVGLDSITMPDSVTSIGDYAFDGCSITKLEIADGAKTITPTMVVCESTLEEVVIPDTVTSISMMTFYKCPALMSITIPKSVTSIGDTAFYDCSALKEIVFEGNAPTFGSNTFYKTATTAYYPAEDATWAEEVRQNYGGTITWVATETVILGDLDNNGIVDDEDVIYLLWHTLMQDEYPVEQDVDFDHNGIVDDEDVIYLLWHTLMPGDYPLDGEFEHSEYFLPGVKVEDVILWFNEVCLDAEYVTGGNPSVVQKWRVPIRYWIYGTPTQEDMETLESFVAQINNIEGFPGMVKADYAAMANLKIHFVNQQGLVNIMGNGYWGHDGAVTFWYDENNVIYKETICVRTDLSQYVRNSVLQEEIYNGLGPVQDTLLRPDSLIYQNYAEPQAMTQVDELLLKLLYHPDIQWGMDAQECEAVIRQLYY